MKYWAVIPSKDRPEMLADLVRSLIKDDVQVVVVDTGYEPAFGSQHPLVHWVRDTEQPPNISRWWNRGLDYVDGIMAMTDNEEFIVAVLNDDIVIPEGFVQWLGVFIVSQDAVGAYPDQHDYFIGQASCHKFSKAEPVSLFMRMPGYAFALRGSAGLRADETLQWWYGDDDLDWRIREAGGNVLVGGLKVEHLSANTTTVGKLAAQAGLDRQTFIDKWRTARW
jgi:GT2 family glycosyltransferase